MSRSAAVPLLGFLLLAAGAPVPAPASSDGSSLPGWAGPDLAAARALTARTDRPVLVLVRRAACVPCDHLETLLTGDPRIAPLTEPFVRVRLSLDDPAGLAVARSLAATRIPGVVLLGPEGKEATRRSGQVERAWLVEQLQIVARRHLAERLPVEPSQAEIQASLERLLEWGDREGAATLRGLLRGDATAAGAAPPPVTLPDRAAAQARLAGLAPRLATVVDPARARGLAHEAALELEASGHTDLALKAYEVALDRLDVDPVTNARAGFMAARHRMELEPVRRRLMAARGLLPESLPLCLALVRVAEASGRIYQAFHIAEAAAVYAPDDAWAALELRRLRLLVRLKSPRGARDPA